MASAMPYEDERGELVEAPERIAESESQLQRNSESRFRYLVMIGYKFAPSDYELLLYFLLRKLFGLRLPLFVIKEINVYSFHPSQLPIDEFKTGFPGEAYFYTKKEKKNDKKPLTRRKAGNGYWRTKLGQEKPLFYGKKCLGFKTTLVYYSRRSVFGIKSPWIMHEYRVNPSSFPQAQHDQHLKSQMENYVVCKIRNKDQHESNNGSQDDW